jgi:FkbM family methyltransferase
MNLRETASLASTAATAVRGLIGQRNWLRLKARKPEFSFLRQARGVIHVGANQGQERDLYAALGLRVVWIEPIAEVFDRLTRNIASLPDQRALNCLITAQDNQQCEFHIANNRGESSSILDLSQHREMWPEVTYTHTIALTGMTLGTALKTAAVDVSQYDALVLDTQGSEYQILSGAVPLLPQFRFIKVEVPDFEAYKNCCQIDELAAFMSNHGFSEHRRITQMNLPDIGSYFEVVYRRNSPPA